MLGQGPRVGQAPGWPATPPRVALSIVIPVYGCTATLRPLHERLTRTLAGLVDSYEIVFVDDRGPGEAWAVLRQLAAEDPHVVACRMSRNVGQQLAITAGLEQCAGDHAVVMDCDLEDPPETIPALLAVARRGADIVFAKRRSDHKPLGRRIAGRVYFRLLGKMAGQRFDSELGAFSLISRRVIDGYLLFRERDRHYLMILYELGFPTATVAYDRATRHAGRSGYSLSKLLAHALSGLVFTTTRLLHGVIYLGLGMAGLGVLLALAIVVLWLRHGAAPGWPSLIIVQLLVGGIVTLCVGVTGLYIGKIFEAAQQRPLFFIQDRLGPARANRAPSPSMPPLSTTGPLGFNQ